MKSRQLIALIPSLMVAVLLWNRNDFGIIVFIAPSFSTMMVYTIYLARTNPLVSRVSQAEILPAAILSSLFSLNILGYTAFASPRLTSLFLLGLCVANALCFYKLLKTYSRSANHHRASVVDQHPIGYYLMLLYAMGAPLSFAFVKSIGNQNDVHVLLYISLVFIGVSSYYLFRIIVHNIRSIRMDVVAQLIACAVLCIIIFHVAMIQNIWFDTGIFFTECLLIVANTSEKDMPLITHSTS